MNRIAIFASGTGTNFDAIVRHINKDQLNAEIVLVVVDKANALIIEKARTLNIDTLVFNPKDYENKQAYETMIVSKLKEKDAVWLILAGYMRIFSNTLLSAFPNRIINIHPSLLPAFKGKNAVGQALAYGVKVMGVTIHYVNEEMDGGEIIAQQAFNVEGLNHQDIEKRVHEIEHQLYSSTLAKLWEDNK